MSTRRETVAARYRAVKAARAPPMAWTSDGKVDHGDGARDFSSGLMIPALRIVELAPSDARQSTVRDGGRRRACSPPSR